MQPYAPAFLHDQHGRALLSARVPARRLPRLERRDETYGERAFRAVVRGHHGIHHARPGQDVPLRRDVRTLTISRPRRRLWTGIRRDVALRVDHRELPAELRPARG